MCHYERSYGLTAAIAQARNSKAQGLIFTPVKTPYTPSRGFDYSPYMFQWRLPEENTFPFKIQILWDKERKAHYQIFVGERQTHKYFDDFTPEQELLRSWRQSPPDGKIVDCVYDPEWVTQIWENGYAATSRKGGWKFVRFRPDRTFADEEKSLNNRFETLINPIELEHIENAAESIRSRWKERETSPADRRLSNPNSDKRSPAVMSPLKSPLADHKRKSIPLSASSPSPKRTKLETLTDKPATNEPEEGQATDEEDEFSEEEELLSGYVPPLKDDINSNLGIQSPLPTYSPSKIHDIAQKTNLSKLTTNQIYIPQPPQSSSIIYNKIEGDVDYDECDNESPLEDLATARYANVDIIKNSIEQAIFNQDLSGVGGGEDDEPTKRNSFWDVI